MARINRRPSANRRSTLTKETPVGPEVNDPFDPSSAGFEIRMEDPSFRAKLDEHFMSMGPPSFTPEPVEEPWTRPPPIEMMGSSFSPAPISKGSGKMFSGVTGELMTPKTEEGLSTSWPEAGEHLGYGSEEELDYARSVGMAPPKGLELPKGYTGSLRRELAASPPTKSMLAGKSIDDYYTDIYGKEYTDDPWRRHGFGPWSEIL